MTKPITKTNPMENTGTLVAVGFAYDKDGQLIVSNVWQKNN